MKMCRVMNRTKNYREPLSATNMAIKVSLLFDFHKITVQDFMKF